MNLDYKIFLIGENGEYAELDGLEQLKDFQTTISINDISDITVKKDTISKNIKIPNTKNNARMLGNLFSHSRYVDNSTDSLRYNFSINRPVDCIVLENSQLIAKGFLKVIEVSKENGITSYECVITGNVVNFYSLLNSDAQLSDLEFPELQHEYNVPNIQNSWNYTTGYVYPFINYGVLNSPKATEVNNIHYSNFRPAIFLTSYLDKIFNLPELDGFTYEVAGSQNFKNEINSLIIPNDQEQLSQTSSGTILTLTNNGVSENGRSYVGAGLLRRILDFPVIDDSMNLVQETNTEIKDSFMWLRSVTSDINISFDLTLSNWNNNPITASIKLLVKDENKDLDLSNFSIGAESFIHVVEGNSTYTSPVTFNVPEKSYAKGSVFTLVFYVEGNNVSLGRDKLPFTITNLQLKTPSTEITKVTYDVVLGDVVKPVPVSNVKIRDFIKSFTQLFNLYTYSSADNPKHIIFESYDDYYRNTGNEMIVDSALDWSNKVDYSGAQSITPYANTNKSYSFTYKSDSDYWNSQYLTNYGNVYGSYSEVDTYKNAINEEKKIEIIFSATPMVNYNNTGRIYPELFKLESGNVRLPLKTNIRLLYYNGLRACETFNIGTMTIDANGNYVFASSDSFTSYPSVGHFLFDSNMNYVNDLNFGLCKQYYFPLKSSINDVPNLYSKYFKNQIKEINDLNMNLYEADVLLNPVDISNLSLKNPVLINGEDGNAYYKIVQVDYNNRFEPSTVQLQKIII